MVVLGLGYGVYVQDCVEFGFKGELNPKPKLTIFCSLSQSYQQCFEK